MEKAARTSLRNYYRQHVYELIDKNPESLVDLIVDQHLAIESLSATIKKQQKVIESLEKKVIALEKRLGEDSHNSHKPPSSDNPYKKTDHKTKSTRKKTGKKPGGQKGHKGYRLEQIDTPDEIVTIASEGSCECGREINNARTIEYLTRQVFDLILPVLTTTEYQGEVKKCACGRIHKPQFPEGVKNKVQYGSVIKSLSVYLKHHGMISYDRLQQLYHELFGINLSQGTLVNFVKECSQNLVEVSEEIKKKIIESKVVHFDESGFRILGSLHWLHCASTDLLTCYVAHKKRGTPAMNAIGILPKFKGTAIHDHWKSYYNYVACRHGLCNVHHLRELIYFAENDEKWAEKAINTLLDAKAEKEVDINLSKQRTVYYNRRLKRILREGLHLHPKREKNDKSRGRQKQSPQYNLLSRLINNIDDVLRFITDSNVPFDNNQGERDIRMLKVQQKVSGGFRSISGADSFCVIRGYISSIRKNGQSVFNAIQSTCSSEVTRPKCLDFR